MFNENLFIILWYYRIFSVTVHILMFYTKNNILSTYIYFYICMYITFNIQIRSNHRLLEKNGNYTNYKAYGEQNSFNGLIAYVHCIYVFCWPHVSNTLQTSVVTFCTKIYLINRMKELYLKIAMPTTSSPGNRDCGQHFLD